METPDSYYSRQAASQASQYGKEERRKTTLGNWCYLVLLERVKSVVLNLRVGSSASIEST